MKRSLGLLLALALLLSVVFAGAACAETADQDGIHITLVADSELYDSQGIIQATLTAVNTNDFPVTNVQMEITAPSGFELVDGGSLSIDSLAAGESLAAQAKLLNTKALPSVPQTGDDSNGGLWLALLILSCGGLCFVFIGSRRANRMIALVLCAAMVSCMIPAAVPAAAQSEQKTLSVSAALVLDGKEIVVRGLVSYDADSILETFTYNDFLCMLDETGKGVVILRYTGSEQLILVPHLINGLPVTRIAEDAFAGLEGIILQVEKGSVAEAFAIAHKIPHEIVAGSSLYTIQNGSISFAPGVLMNLTSLDLPASVVTIGASVFEGCVKLESIGLPEGLTTIGARAFAGCTSLTSVVLPSTVTSIGNEAFYGCSSLVSITIPAGATLGTDVFEGCSSLLVIYGYRGSPAETYAAEHGITFRLAPDADSTAASAFTYTTADGSCTITGYTGTAKNVVIPQTIGGATVTAIAAEAFMGNTTIATVEIPDSVTSIGSYAFKNCTALTKIVLPSGIKTVSSYMFDGCSSLAFAALPKTVTTIGAGAFCNCTSLCAMNEY